MDITHAYKDRDSTRDFTTQLGMYIDSGAGVIHVRTNEPIRALAAIRRHAITESRKYREWDIVSGFRSFEAATIDSHVLEGDNNTDLGSAFSVPLGSLRDVENGTVEPHPEYFVYVNPHVFMESNPHLGQLLSTYVNLLPHTSIRLIMVTPDTPLPDTGVGNILSIRFEPPGLAELKASLTDLVESVENDFNEVSIEDEDFDKICFVGAGMTKASFETYTALSIVQAGRSDADTLTTDNIIKGVMVGKTDIVNSNDLLELYPSADMSNVGGMENLKEWVSKRARCYSDEAKEFGVEPPKGMVFVGPPGVGKSLVGKSIASVLGIPLVRLDFGRVFNSLVGASEQRMRTALHMVETMSPCVLLCDEIDKGLGGIGGSSDGGTSNRVLGSFLTWLQDCEYPVFTMVTANNIDGLPPELMRRGRFDAIFSTGLPTAKERRDVLKIHLKLRGRDIDMFSKADIDKVVDASNKYVPAEIESAVKDALVDAFYKEEEFTLDHVMEALAAMVPLSEAYKDKIDAMTAWAAKNATPAGATEEQKARIQREVRNRSRISPRVRGK